MIRSAAWPRCTADAIYVRALFDAAADPAWCLSEPDGAHAIEQDVEARLAIGNGAFGMRAAFDQRPLLARPATFVAGLFDLRDREPRVPALVAAPDWLQLSLLVDGEQLEPGRGETLEYWRRLDMRTGLLMSSWRQRTPSGRIVRLSKLRLASLADHALALQVARVEVDQPATITLLRVVPPTSSLQLVSAEPGLQVWRTRSGTARLALATSSTLRTIELEVEADALREQRWSVRCDPDTPATFVRAAALVAERPTEGDFVARARASLRHVQHAGLADAIERHQRAWRARWHASDVEIDGDPAAQQAVRCAVYHMLSAANPEDEHVSIGARGLTGEGYLGHVFWDTDTFLLPFYTLTWPEAARALLKYRYQTLPGARAKAAELGFRGALYAWESADTGEDVTPKWQLARDGQVVPILCGRQEQHISADVAYAVWQYWQATHDVSFLLDAGAEILLETARFWASRATLESDGRYHIRGVIGPDEYHESVDDNAYTNGLASWNLERGLEVAGLLRARWPDRWRTLSRRLALPDGEVETWRVVAAGLVTGFDPASGRIEQFDGFSTLEQIDPHEYATLAAAPDVMLGAERIGRSQVIKQPDVLMLLALLPDLYEPCVQQLNFDYYEPRCAHGSSLSPAIHALVAARLRRLDRALAYFQQAAGIDLADTRGNTAQGMHMGALGGLWQAVVFGFGGLHLDDSQPRLTPHLPIGWQRLGFHVRCRGRSLRVELRRDAPHAPELEVEVALESGRPLSVQVGDERQRISRAAPGRWRVQEDVR